jgi:Holliday junction DNA helicase RuvA
LHHAYNVSVRRVRPRPAAVGDPDLIGSLSGRLLEKSPIEIVLDVGGVGYRIAVPTSTFGRLPEIGQALTLSIHTQVREDALSLYGFESRRERDLFEKLISVPGIGPRLALAVHSHLSPRDLVTTVRARDAARLTTVPGIGKKMAERLIIELKSLLDKKQEFEFGGEEIAAGGTRADLQSALENLGYKPAQIAPVLDKILEGNDSAPVESLLREALRGLAAPMQAKLRATVDSVPPPAPATKNRARQRSSS